MYIGSDSIKLQIEFDHICMLPQIPYISLDKLRIASCGALQNSSQPSALVAAGSARDCRIGDAE